MGVYLWKVYRGFRSECSQQDSPWAQAWDLAASLKQPVIGALLHVLSVTDSGRLLFSIKLKHD